MWCSFRVLPFPLDPMFAKGGRVSFVDETRRIFEMPGLLLASKIGLARTNIWRPNLALYEASHLSSQYG